LPWKQTRDPYHIWLSEIILQQTRVEQGTPYYFRFVETYPTVLDLANASQESVLKSWEGLGYYSRARNLHAAASQVVQEYGGKFPDSYEEILKLKGVGGYTAAAIASFAFDLPYAVLDGNVFRVLSRFFGIDIPIDSTQGKKYFSQLAQDCLDKEHPADYNQAIMDFGAMVCKPVNPNCNNCPLSSHCKAYNEDRIKELPYKSKKIIRQTRFFNFLVLTDKTSVCIVQRSDNDIWKGLHQFPCMESEDLWVEVPENILSRLPDRIMNIKFSNKYKQILTHRNIEAQFVEIELDNIPVNFEWNRVPTEDIVKYTFPKIIREYLTDRFNCII